MLDGVFSKSVSKKKKKVCQNHVIDKPPKKLFFPQREEAMDLGRQQAGQVPGFGVYGHPMEALMEFCPTKSLIS